MFSPLRTFTHVITSQAVELEAQAMTAALVRGGYLSGSELDLTQVAAHQLVDQAMSNLREANVAVRRRIWDRASDGEVHLVLELDREADMVHAAMVLG